MADSAFLETIELLKIQQGEYINYQSNDADAAIALFKKVVAGKTDTWVGKEFREAVMLQLPRSGSSIGHGGSLSEPGKMKVGHLTVTPAIYNDALRVTHFGREWSKTEKAAFGEEFTVKSYGLAEHAKSQKARKIHGTGRGCLAQVSAAALAGTSTLTLDNPGLFPGTFGGARFITAGQVLAVVDPADTSIVTVVEVASVPTPSSFTTTTPLAVPVADDSLIYIAAGLGATDIATSTNRNAEMLGLGAIVNNAAVHPDYLGIDRNIFPIMSSTVFPSVGSLSSDLLRRMTDAAMNQGGKTNLTSEDACWVMHHDIRNAYVALSEPERRYTMEYLNAPDVGTKAMTGGILKAGQLPIAVSRTAPYTEFVLFCKEGSKHFTSQSGFLKETGSEFRILQNNDGFDTLEFKANWVEAEQFYHTRPNSCVRATGVTVANTFSPWN